jgi:hypothetical protein
MRSGWLISLRINVGTVNNIAIDLGALTGAPNYQGPKIEGE